jgi:hypothetical protein
MASFFPQNNPSQRNIHEQKYRSARMYLLIVILSTVVNLALLTASEDSYMLFSAFIPYLIVSLGMYMCGRFPDDYYTEGWEDTPFLDNSFLIVTLIISFVLFLLYILAWRMSSKNRGGWLIFALVLFGFDTISLFLLIDSPIDLLISLAFHALAIYELIVGIRAWCKLKALPPEEESENPSVEENDFYEIPNSTILRIADKEIKHRVFLQARAFDLDICYRRVKHTNELVINGNVYDEFIGVYEPPHALQAQINGHYVEAGYTGMHSVISVDGNIIAKKIRWV